jgi:hypothetical protein
MMLIGVDCLGHLKLDISTEGRYAGGLSQAPSGVRMGS